MTGSLGVSGPQLSARAVFIRYVCFAGLAAVANLATQAAVARAAPVAGIMASVAAGTVAGFVVKYWLDKRWVFLDAYDSHAAEVRKVFVYGISSVGTTLLFWGVELGFWFIWGTAEAKYLGALIGLSLGN